MTPEELKDKATDLTLGSGYALVYALIYAADTIADALYAIARSKP